MVRGVAFSRLGLVALVLAGCAGGSGHAGDDQDESSGTEQYPSIIGGWSGEDGALEFGVGTGAVASCARLDWLSISVGSSGLCSGGVCTQSETRYYYDVPLSASGSEYLFAVADDAFTVSGTLHSPSKASGTVRYRGDDLPDWTAEHVSAPGGGEACPPGGIGPCEGRTRGECVGECIPSQGDRIELARGCRLATAPFSCLSRPADFGSNPECEGELVALSAGEAACWVVGADCVDSAFDPVTSSAECDEEALSLEDSLDLLSLPECSELDDEEEASRGACGRIRSCCCQLPEASRADCLSITDAPDATDLSCYQVEMAGFEAACTAAGVDFSIPGDCAAPSAPQTFACSDIVACCEDRNDPAVAETCVAFFAMCAASADATVQGACQGIEQISSMAPEFCAQSIASFETLDLCTP